MRNFMEAYNAVHSKEAKEELYSKRDPISEMNTASLQDNDLRDLAEDILEEVFETSTVKEAEDIIFNMIPESNIVGREEKLERIYAAFGETFSRIKLKNQSKQMEEFAKYRQQKRLEETWSARFNQEKRVQRVHSTVVAEDVAIIKKGLLGLFNEKKADPCWVGYKQVGMKKKGGKMVPNCVSATEAAQYDEMYKGKHGQTDKQYADSRSQGGKMISGDSKMSGAEYTHGRRVKAANPGMQPDVGGKTKPKSQGKMDKGTRSELMYRKTNLKKEEVEVDEAMSSYDRNRKRAAQRAAARNAARDAGKTGVVPGVGYVSPRRERETYVDSAGTTRHKSGAKMEEFELQERGMNPGFKAYLEKQKKKGGDDEGGDAPKGGSKPDFLDLDKDGDKKESMKKAAHDKKKGMKEELESSGKFSETEILKIIASL